jgi:hypothetical protein
MPAANNGSQPMRVLEDHQSLYFAQATLSGDKDALRNPALAVAENVSNKHKTSDSASVIFY